MEQTTRIVTVIFVTCCLVLVLFPSLVQADHTSVLSTNTSTLTTLHATLDVNFSIMNLENSSNNITLFNISQTNYPLFNFSGTADSSKSIVCQNNASLINCSAEIDPNTTGYLLIRVVVSADANYSFTLTSIDNTTNTSGDTTFIYVDGTAPSIENVTNTSANTAFTVYWNTTEPANCTLEYGTDPTLGSSNSSTGFGLGCSLQAAGLSRNTTYYYNMTSCDIYTHCTTTGPSTILTTNTTIPTSLSFAIAYPSLGCVDGEGSISTEPACELCYFETTDLNGTSTEQEVSCQGQNQTTSFITIDSQTATALNFTLALNESLPAAYTLKASQIGTGYEASCSGDPAIGCVDITTTPQIIFSNVVNTTTSYPYDAQLWLFADFISAVPSDTDSFQGTLNSSAFS